MFELHDKGRLCGIYGVQSGIRTGGQHPRFSPATPVNASYSYLYCQECRSVNLANFMDINWAIIQVHHTCIEHGAMICG
jgi:hypothetical protein